MSWCLADSLFFVFPFDNKNKKLDFFCIVLTYSYL